MSKRSFPFNSYSPLQLKTHVESKHVNNNEESMMKVYARTQSILKAGARAQAKVEKNNNEQANVCNYCKTVTLPLAQCSFCEIKVCANCFNVCFTCEQNFCPICSIISYADPVEKSYCLSCTGR